MTLKAFTSFNYNKFITAKNLTISLGINNALLRDFDCAKAAVLQEVFKIITGR